MRKIKFPAPLRPGDRIGVTAPSAGVGPDLRPRLDFTVRTLRARGYEVVLGDCLDGTGHVSAPAADRAAELTRMLTDPDIRAVLPPRGGSTAIELLARLDWDALRAAEPTWFIGYSDISTLLMPFTLRTGIATLHGSNLLDTPYQPASGLLSWLDIAESPAASDFTQTSPGRYHVGGGPIEWTGRPEATELALDHPGGWRRLDGDDDVRISGRLIGGCLETLTNLAGTPFGDLTAFAEQYSAEDLVIYLEVSGADSDTVCSALHGMRLAGFFDAAAAILMGRTAARGLPTLTQDQAVLEALAEVGVPIVADVECGHVPPSLPLVNGARATVTLAGGVGRITQYLD